MWQPYAVAAVVGLVVSAGLYLVVWRPLCEPAEDEPAADAPAADATDEVAS